jgi:hypothetical protein
MSVSTYLQAFRDLDGKFKKMMEAKKYCDKNNLSYPKEIKEYFGELLDQNDKDIEDEMAEIDIENVIEEYKEEMSEGFEIELSKLPKEVKKIRFINSY